MAFYKPSAPRRQRQSSALLQAVRSLFKSKFSRRTAWLSVENEVTKANGVLCTVRCTHQGKTELLPLTDLQYTHSHTEPSVLFVL